MGSGGHMFFFGCCGFIVAAMEKNTVEATRTEDVG